MLHKIIGAFISIILMLATVPTGMSLLNNMQLQAVFLFGLLWFFIVVPCLFIFLERKEQGNDT